MSGYRIPDEDTFEWVPEGSEKSRPFSRRLIVSAMIIRLIIIGVVIWWIFGQFSSDASELFEMGRTFVLR